MPKIVRSTHSPIFIVGAPRSGTTLLQYMLRSHPDLSIPTAESHFFIPFYQRRNEFGDLNRKENLQSFIEQIYHAKKDFFDDDFHGIKFDIEKFTIDCNKQGISTIPNIIDYIFQKNSLAEGKKRWGDKTPYYILHLNTIVEMFPQAQIVHIIRDGRDCALSMLERKWDLQIFNTYHAAYTWDKYIKAGKKFGSEQPSCYFEVRYEDILDKPEISMSQLCNFLNIEFNPKILDFNKPIGSGKTPLLRQPLQPNNQAKWRNKMSDKQLSIFEALAGETLTDCKYELATKNQHITNSERLKNEAYIKLCQLYKKYF